MYVWANFLNASAVVLDFVLTFYMWVIVIRALISWVNPDPYNPIVQFLYRVTEPVLSPIRRKLPIRTAGIDLSPIIAILIILFLQYFLIASLKEYAIRMKY